MFDFFKKKYKDEGLKKERPVKPTYKEIIESQIRSKLENFSISKEYINYLFSYSNVKEDRITNSIFLDNVNRKFAVYTKYEYFNPKIKNEEVVEYIPFKDLDIVILKDASTNKELYHIYTEKFRWNKDENISKIMKQLDELELPQYTVLSINATVNMYFNDTNVAKEWFLLTLKAFEIGMKKI